MPLVVSNYQRPAYLFHAHLETIVPALTRRVPAMPYERERITIFDNDFLDLDWYQTGSKSLLIISHGLEGNSTRPYVLGLTRYFRNRQWDVLAWNHRGCSGEINHLPRFYHSGATEDLRAVVQHVLQTKPHYDQIVLAGFSLGGNMTLKYLGEEAQQVNPKIKKAFVYSVPLHLSSCSRSLCSPRNWVYAQKFKKSLLEKVRIKARSMPNAISTVHIPKVKTLKDFDDYYTAPLHQFEDAEDYYAKSSSLHYLQHIAIPTLIINAQNDPFLAPECFPYDLITNLEQVYFETPATGGHCGFSPADAEGAYWSERRAWNFVENKDVITNITQTQKQTT
ncbi:MAG: alpha/beta fold hydrolase [Cytophagales bacterium]|nr:MAG: alpha/beta fold hydrolase [Cytophagales bacterium]